MSCPLSQQQDESMPFVVVIAKPCKMTAKALPGLILVLLKGQGCAAYSGLPYKEATGQQQP